MTERAPAKINLCLLLGAPRAEDGRHELVSVMQSLTLADELALGPRPGAAGACAAAPVDEVVCEGVEGPNLAGAALAAFRAATGWDAPAQRLEIVKRVPVAAGMGGGSGDAAAALRLAARASGRLDEALLLELAAGLGADVPAQVRPGRSLATGAGERVRALGDGPPFGVLILPGPRPLPTAAVYAQADRMGLPRPPAELAALEADLRCALGLEPRAGGGGSAPGLAAAVPQALLVNDLQPAALALDPAIDAALEQARDAGADHVMVSGSGPTALGLFLGAGGPERARAAARRLAARRPAPLVAEPEPGWPPPAPTGERP